MGIDEILDLISELEGQRDDIEDELDELYRERQELWEEERMQALAEYERSVIP